MARRVGEKLLQVTNYIPGQEPYDVRRPQTAHDLEMMSMALGQGQLALDAGNPPIGCVLFDTETERVWPNFTQDKSSDNLLDHAEILSYQEGQPIVGTNLARCALYTTTELCTMCTTVYSQGKIGQIVTAASRQDIRWFFRTGETHIDMHQILANQSFPTSVTRGVMKDEARNLFEEYRVRKQRAAPSSTKPRKR